MKSVYIQDQSLNVKTSRIVFYFVLFMVFPLMGILLLLIEVLSAKHINKIDLFLFFLLLAFYLGAINATKTPISDQFNYMMAYKEVPQMGFVKSLFNLYGSDKAAIHGASSKEFGFGVLNYIGYYLTFGNYPLFIFLFSVGLYYILFYSIYLFYIETCKEAKMRIIAGVLSISFFTQFFNLTIHLQRQEIAVVVMMLAIVKSLRQGKINWILSIVACSLHTSVVLFMPGLLLGKSFKQMSKKWILCFLLMWIMFFVFVNILGLYFTNVMGETYVFDRMVTAGESEEHRKAMSLVLLITIPMLLISLKKLFFSDKQTVKRERVLYFIYVQIALSIFVISDNTLQYRFFMMSYVFIPFLFPQIFDNRYFPVSLNKFFNLVIPVFLIIRFYVTFEDIVFEYAPLSDVLVNNFFYLLTYRM